MNAKISALILAAYSTNGGDLRNAIDTVLGAGSFDKLAGDVYDTLRAR